MRFLGTIQQKKIYKIKDISLNIKKQNLLHIDRSFFYKKKENNCFIIEEVFFYNNQAPILIYYDMKDITYEEITYDDIKISNLNKEFLKKEELFLDNLLTVFKPTNREVEMLYNEFKNDKYLTEFKLNNNFSGIDIDYLPNNIIKDIIKKSNKPNGSVNFRNHNRRKSNKNF